jgi:hypothetical protein
MNVIALQFEASPVSNDYQVRPIIDDADLLQLLQEDSLGIDPTELFRQPALGNAGKLLIGRCSCEVVGCGDVIADISVADGFVTWRLGVDQSYRFEIQQYLECFAGAAQDTTWESTGRTAERVVSSLSFEQLEILGYRFQWASTRIRPGFVTLSFSTEGAQRLFEVEWDGLQAKDAEQQVRHWLTQHF